MNCLSQCKFAFDNPTLLGIMEPESDTEDALDAGGLANQTTKKRKRTVGGCIAKGEDFWGQVDTYFRKEIASRGQNLAGSGWKECMPCFALPYSGFDMNNCFAVMWMRLSIGITDNFQTRVLMAITQLKTHQ